MRGDAFVLMVEYRPVAWAARDGHREPVLDRHAATVIAASGPSCVEITPDHTASIGWDRRPKNHYTFIGTRDDNRAASIRRSIERAIRWYRSERNLPLRIRAKARSHHGEIVFLRCIPGEINPYGIILSRRQSSR